VIKAVIFDFFGVLSSRALGDFVTDYFDTNDNHLQEVRKIRSQADLGQISRQELIKKLAALAGVPIETVLSYENSAAINEKLIDFIRQKLKAKYKIGILSNASGDYAKEEMSREDYKLFDDALVSYHFGLVKPNPEIYLLAAKRLGVKPAEAVFIDDKEICTNGAKAIGMQTVWYRDFPQMKQQLEKILTAGSDN